MRTGFFAVLAISLAACSLPVVQKGDACERSAECAAGLACVQGKCGTNLQSIADKNTSPDLGLGDAAANRDGAADAAADAAATDAMTPADAAAAKDAG